MIRIINKVKEYFSNRKGDKEACKKLLNSSMFDILSKSTTNSTAREFIETTETCFNLEKENLNKMNIVNLVHYISYLDLLWDVDNPCLRCNECAFK